ncbi:MAG TPA: helix-turn-helix domain-containing protein [Tepidisphaeraceae bacterium]
MQWSLNVVKAKGKAVNAAEGSPPFSPVPQLLRPREVSQRLGLSRAMTYRLIESGELKAIRIGKSIRVDVAEVARFVNERRSGDGAA